MNSTVLYTAQADVTGGRDDGHGRTVDGGLDVRLRQPKELGGDGGGVNPEQLFAIGYAACFASSIGLVGKPKQLAVDDVAIESRVSLSAADDGAFRLGVTLNVTLPSIADAGEAAALVEAAHRICPYSNATRGNISVTLTAYGTSL